MKHSVTFPLERPHCGVPMANGYLGVLVWGIPVEPLEWLDPKWVKNNVTDRMTAPL